MKACADCKWSRIEDADVALSMCRRPAHNKKKQRITGNGACTIFSFCDIERDHGRIVARMLGVCGKRARYFEPRIEPTWQEKMSRDIDRIDAELAEINKALKTSLDCE